MAIAVIKKKASEWDISREVRPEERPKASTWGGKREKGEEKPSFKWTGRREKENSTDEERSRAQKSSKGKQNVEDQHRRPDQQHSDWFKGIEKRNYEKEEKAVKFEWTEKNVKRGFPGRKRSLRDGGSFKGNKLSGYKTCLGVNRSFATLQQKGGWIRRGGVKKGTLSS